MVSHIQDIPKYDVRVNSITTALTPTLILRADVNRVGVYFQHHDGAAELFLAPKSLAPTGEGFRLFANSAPLVFRWDDDGILPALEWYAYSLAAPFALYAVELLYYPRSERRD